LILSVIRLMLLLPLDFIQLLYIERIMNNKPTPKKKKKKKKKKII